MKFVRLEDVPKEFLDTRIKAGSKERVMPKGMELVWDVEAEDFRVFNYSSQVGALMEVAFSQEEKNNFFAIKTLDNDPAVCYDGVSTIERGEK